MFDISRIIAAVLSATLCLLMAGGCHGEMTEGLTITVLDVGKADSIVVQEVTGGAMLIDTGTKESADTVLDFLRQEGISSLSMLILTHMDKDHVGGAAAVLEAVTVERVLQADYDRDNASSSAYKEALAASGVTPERLREPVEASLGEAAIRVLPGEKTAYEQSNDYSLMTEIVYGSRRMLFAGDAERERLQEYLEGEPQACDFLKVPHHGGTEKNSAAFLAATSPAYAVITCSEEEPPDEEILTLLKMAGAKVYLTSDGTVTAECDGRSLRVRQERPQEKQENEEEET